MQVFIILDSQRHLILNVEPTDRILYLKAKIEEIKGIHFGKQQLTYLLFNTIQSKKTLCYD